MPLRKSPRRTRALLAANRRNARKSNGPRTELGKWHSAGNAVRHYRRTLPSSCIPIENREIKAFEDFHFALREAIMPADNAAGTEAALLNAARVWRVKRSFDRWIATRTEEDWLVLAAGAVPRPRSWRLKLRRPGLSAPDWVVTASVCLRWGRGPGRSRRPATEDDEKDRPRMHTPRMHAIVSVHSTGPFRPAQAVEGQPTEPQLERTKPECDTMQSGSKNMSVAGCRLPVVGGDRIGRFASWWSMVRGQLLGQGKLQPGPKTDHRKPQTERRTKPESYSSQSGSENMSAPSRREAAFAAGCALADRLIGWLMGRSKRTKPEYGRKQTSC